MLQEKRFRIEDLEHKCSGGYLELSARCRVFVQQSCRV